MLIPVLAAATLFAFIFLSDAGLPDTYLGLAQTTGSATRR